MTLDRVRLTELLAFARGRGASDLHVGVGEPPVLRIAGSLTTLDVPPLGAAALEAFVADVGPRPADVVCRSGAGAPYRLHAYRSMRGLRLAFRLLAADVPSLEALLLPPIVATLAEKRSGLLLFTGPTGSGKTTALAALVDHINATSERVIVTVEDPVEYVHRSRRSVVVHCALGDDVASYAEALHGFMRADPDVILVGEMRERTTMEAALSAAETGHLVLSTVHTADASQTVDRIVDAFPTEAQGQIRSQLAGSLLGVVSLRLVPARAGGRVLASEVLTGTDAVRAMIRDGKTHQLRNAILTGRATGMQTLEAALSELTVRGTIDVEAARSVAARPAEVRELARVAG